jgi:hypothetical protein
MCYNFYVTNAGEWRTGLHKNSISLLSSVWTYFPHIASQLGIEGFWELPCHSAIFKHITLQAVISYSFALDNTNSEILTPQQNWHLTNKTLLNIQEYISHQYLLKYWSLCGSNWPLVSITIINRNRHTHNSFQLECW